MRYYASGRHSDHQATTLDLMLIQYIHRKLSGHRMQKKSLDTNLLIKFKNCFKLIPYIHGQHMLLQDLYSWFT